LTPPNIPWKETAAFSLSRKDSFDIFAAIRQVTHHCIIGADPDVQIEATHKHESPETFALCCLCKEI
jgi:hypothetical protein